MKYLRLSLVALVRPFLSSKANVGKSGDFLLSFDLSYELALWGRIRRTVTASGGR
jgi:outer membrane protein TolC